MRPEKQFLLDEIKEKFDQSTALVLTKYQKMSPNLASDFRIQMGKSGGEFEVVRKRILMKALAASGVTLDKDLLQGHIGVLFVLQDPVAVTKQLFKFSKQHEDVFEILGGRFEGKLCTAKDVAVIASLPDKDQMRSQFLSVLEAPMAQTLAVIDALLSSVMHCLENKSKIES